MKKGLRRLPIHARCRIFGNTDRPDEEGIKTIQKPLSPPLDGNTDRPDEEGIKTRADIQISLRVGKHRQT